MPENPYPDVARMACADYGLTPADLRRAWNEGAAAKQAEIVKLLRDPASPLHHDVQLHTRTLLTAADLIERGGEQEACKHSLCQCDPATGRVECAHCGAVVERGGE